MRSTNWKDCINFSQVMSFPLSAVAFDTVECLNEAIGNCQERVFWIVSSAQLKIIWLFENNVNQNVWVSIGWQINCFVFCKNASAFVDMIESGIVSKNNAWLKNFRNKKCFRMKIILFEVVKITADFVLIIGSWFCFCGKINLIWISIFKAKKWKKVKKSNKKIVLIVIPIKMVYLDWLYSIIVNYIVAL